MVIFIVRIIFVLSKHNGDFYCSNYLLSFRKKKLNQVCKKKYFCGVVMASEDTMILEFNQYQNSDWTLSIIYAYLEFLIKKVKGCKNNSEKSFTTKLSEHTPCGCLLSTIWIFNGIENKHDV